MVNSKTYTVPMDEAAKIKIQNDGIGNILKEIKERLMRTLQLNHHCT